MDVSSLSEKVVERYRRYLETTFHFRDPELRQSFRDALRSQYLSKGPFLEATPPFAVGSTPRSLFKELLGRSPEESFLSAIDGDRRLYIHQEEAIRRVMGGRNVVVATGTGSGKTEAFLYPVLLHLYREHLEGTLGPGVRALILYPMNALANDQRDRLSEICKNLEKAGSKFRFTFGQYTGDTPEHARDSMRMAQDRLRERQHSAEMVLRSEMRDNPPHILLTNYSMLEYLLIRPKDSPFFDGGRGGTWKFVIVDEAHQYRGSRGMEMAMLLSRLKQRVKEGGCTTPLRCVATSASLAGDRSDIPAVARFAANLFGEPFLDEDVITASVVDPAEGSHGGVELDVADYTLLKEILENDAAGPMPRELAARIESVARKVGADAAEIGDPRAVVWRILLNDARASRLRRMVTGRPEEISRVAEAVFGGASREDVRALSDLVDLMMSVRNPADGSPLLSARYHLFLRSLEGAWVSYVPEKRVYLDRRSVSEGSASFEVALCRECGQHYFVGRVRNGVFVEAVRDPSHPDFGVVFLRPITGLLSDAGPSGSGGRDAASGDAAYEDEEAEDTSGPVMDLCAECGQIGHTLGCGHSRRIRVIVEKASESAEGEDKVGKCGCCGYRGGHDPVRELVYGAAGPHSVVATTLHQYLPDERRKVLAFADGRQEAAFFAWYLGSTYKDLVNRHLLLEAIRELHASAGDGISLRELASRMVSCLRRVGAVGASTGALEARREAWKAVYREFLTDETRLSLEGVGLVKWRAAWPEGFRGLEVFKGYPWGLDDDEASNVVVVLFDYMKKEGAVELRVDSGLGLDWEDLQLRKPQSMVQIAPTGGGTRTLRTTRGTVRHGQVRYWDGPRGRRAGFLARILESSIEDEGERRKHAVDALRQFWDAVTSIDSMADSPADRLWLTVGSGGRLNPDWWRVSPVRGANGTGIMEVYCCDVCGRLSTVSVRGVCPRSGCPGRLRPADPELLAQNHYRVLYEEDLPGSLHVEEHTAQIDHDRARQYQRGFKEKRIHVLSCSTTFELGVDLGDLDTVFLRNVRPEPFNYAQRVGRAGRRRGYPGFAITFCRRSPHDLYHFSEPGRILTGKTRIPVLSMRNEKIVGRHVTAVALSEFFRRYQERFGWVKHFFVDLSQPRACADVRSYLVENRAVIERKLQSIVPAELREAVGLHDGSWIDRVCGTYLRVVGDSIEEEDSRLLLAEAEVSSDYKHLQAFKNRAAAEEEYSEAEWARDRLRTIEEEDVLTFLSRKSVLPKYGFPVDVVELDTHRTRLNEDTSAILLQRDLSIALSEFAPGSEIIANKKLWTSYGLKRVAEKEWDRKYYKRCLRHNVFLSWGREQPEPPVPCGCDVRRHEYIVPGFGFVTPKARPKEPTGQPGRLFTTRPYFAGPIGPDPGSVTYPEAEPLVVVRKASPGQMVVLCEGRRGEGFYICRACGAGVKRGEVNHKSFDGRRCSGRLDLVSLAHEFETDVLRIRFLKPPGGETDPMWFAHSIAYALVEGAASVLEVPSDDLSAVVAYGDAADPVPPVILYDGVPGGAGLVAQIEREDVLRACLEAAHRRVAGGCGCGFDSSCYGCLRSYRNQFAHQYLSRGPVKQYLEYLLEHWR